MATALTCIRCGQKGPAGALHCPSDGQALTHDGVSLVGRTLSGRFHVLRLIGAGSMATVYEAELLQNGAPEPAAERRVAVKVLRPKFARDPEALARFSREADLAQTLGHPGVVGTLELGTLNAPDIDVPLPFLVMEFVDGISLETALEQAHGAFDLPKAVRIVLAVADVLAAAHRAHIVHRDLKPANIMLVRTPEGESVRLLDFGLGRSHRAASDLTRKGALYGTPEYMAPEAARGEPSGPRGDVYALATILYRCLRGHTPFFGDSSLRIVVEKTSRPAPLLTEAHDGTPIPRALTALLAANLDKEASRRAPDAEAFQRALQGALAEIGPSSERSRADAG